MCNWCQKAQKNARREKAEANATAAAAAAAAKSAAARATGPAAAAEANATAAAAAAAAKSAAARATGPAAAAAGAAAAAVRAAVVAITAAKTVAAVLEKASGAMLAQATAKLQGIAVIGSGTNVTPPKKREADDRAKGTITGCHDSGGGKGVMIEIDRCHVGPLKNCSFWPDAPAVGTLVMFRARDCVVTTADLHRSELGLDQQAVDRLRQDFRVDLRQEQRYDGVGPGYTTHVCDEARAMVIELPPRYGRATYVFQHSGDLPLATLRRRVHNFACLMTSTAASFALPRRALWEDLTLEELSAACARLRDGGARESGPRSFLSEVAEAERKVGCALDAEANPISRYAGYCLRVNHINPEQYRGRLAEVLASADALTLEGAKFRAGFKCRRGRRASAPPAGPAVMTTVPDPREEGPICALAATAEEPCAEQEGGEEAAWAQLVLALAAPVAAHRKCSTAESRNWAASMVHDAAQVRGLPTEWYKRLAGIERRLSACKGTKKGVSWTAPRRQVECAVADAADLVGGSDSVRIVRKAMRAAVKESAITPKELRRKFGAKFGDELAAGKLVDDEARRRARKAIASAIIDECRDTRGAK
jgi:hypothetical protein